MKDLETCSHKKKIKMNIVVRSYGSNLCYCRPDTTWERENRDLYSPECVNGWNWAPIVFVRISKAGKCINPKFTSRYYDGFNFGALLYGCIGNQEVDSDHGYTSCIDHTSILPFPLYNPAVIENEENTFIVSEGGNILFERDCHDIRTIIEDSICKASQLTSLRIGDFVAIELAGQTRLACRADGDTAIKATFCDNGSFDFKVIF